jgi:hypothetical protein
VNLFQYLFSQYFWLLCLAVTVYDYVAVRRRLAATADLDADAAAGLNEYLRRFALVTSIPWLIMGAGQIVGSTPAVWYYFRPQDRNPFVLAWFGSIFLVSVWYAYWVLLAGGAKITVELGKVSRGGTFPPFLPLSEFWVKVFAAIGPFFVVGWAWLVASQKIPLFV